MPNVPWRTKITEHVTTFSDFGLDADTWYHRETFENMQKKTYLLVKAAAAIPDKRACVTNESVDSDGILEVKMTTDDEGNVSPSRTSTWALGLNSTGAEVASGDYFWMQTGGPAVGTSATTDILEGWELGHMAFGKLKRASTGGRHWLSREDVVSADNDVKLFIPYWW
jgi:hypothetical protein